LNVRIAEAEPLGRGNILYVGGSGPNNYTKIQDAVNAANNGDTVFVYNGTYYENVIINKIINLIGEDRNGTIIDGNGSGDVVNITAEGVTIEGFTIRNGANAGGIIMGPIEYCTIRDNMICNNNGAGIASINSSNCSVYNNTLAYNNMALYAEGGNNYWCVYNNTIYNNTYGGILFGYYSHNCSIYNNNISNNEDSIVIDSVRGFNIYSNNITNNRGDGIALQFSDNCNVYNNNISKNQEGIWIASSENCSIYDNAINTNWYGIILISYSSNCSIYNNNIGNNTYGIFILYFSNNNLIYNNYFDNIINAYDEGNNIWNISKTSGTNIVGGPYLGGNYWSDYTGVDTDGDGLGDMNLPYNCSGNITSGGDWLPLTTTVTIDYIAITFSTKNEIYDCNMSCNFSFNAYASAFNNTYGFVGLINANWSILNNASNAGINSTNGKCIEFNSGNKNGIATLIAEYNGLNDSIVFNINSSMFSFMLHQGWNFVTLPCENNYTASSLYNSIQGCNLILKWNNSKNDFDVYVPGSPNNFAIENGIGYFISVDYDTIFSLLCNPIQSVNITLLVGWNSLGWFKEEQTNASNIYNSISGCNIVLRWNNSRDDFDVYVPGAPDFVIEQGNGFFVSVSQQSQWHG